MDTNKKEIGSRIRIIRNELGLTMDEFGKLFSPAASDSIVSRWERGVSVPSKDRLSRISELGNVSMPYLLEGKYMIGDTHIMPTSERNKLAHGVSAFETISTNVRPSILALLNEEENLSDGDWYLLYMTTKFIASTDDDLLKKKMGIYLNSLTQIIEDTIPKKHLNSEVESLSKELAQLPYTLMQDKK